MGRFLLWLLTAPFRLIFYLLSPILKGGLTAVGVIIALIVVGMLLWAL